MRIEGRSMRSHREKKSFSAFMGLEDRGTTSRQALLEIEVFVVVIAWKVPGVSTRGLDIDPVGLTCTVRPKLPHRQRLLRAPSVLMRLSTGGSMFRGGLWKEDAKPAICWWYDLFS